MAAEPRKYGRLQSNITWLSCIIVVFLFLPIVVRAESFNKVGLRNRFDTLDAAINNGEGYSASTNESGKLAWAESYLLQAYLDMYEATKDNTYLDRFVRQAERVAGNTDKGRGIKDYKGASLTGWSARKYSKNGEPMVHVVNSGMILHPLVQFGIIVKSDPGLACHVEVAERFVRLAEDAVAEFETQWRFDPVAGEGSYWFVGDEPMQANLSSPMPLNGPLALGRVIIDLYRITGKESYLVKAKGLAKYFKAGLRQDARGAYVWGYRQDLKKYPKYEDISHGTIDVDFAVLAFQEGIVFTEVDMSRFSRTIVQAKQGGLYGIYVDGTSDKSDRRMYSDSSGGWLELSVYDCGVYDSVFEYLFDRTKNSKVEHPELLLGIAKLLKYYDRCRGVNNITGATRNSIGN